MKTTFKILFLMLITLLLNIQNPQTADAQCHIDDWTALKALYESTNGDFWTNRAGWGTILPGNPPANCNLESLYGVELGTNGRVEELVLEANKLNGNIPPELGILDNLKLLELYDNQLIGNIPPELGNLSNLEYLSLSTNQLSGNIPTEIGNLNNLTTLHLSRNQLVGNIPSELGNLTELKQLALSSNQLSGSIPSELGNLTNLMNLGLEVNRISGSIPPELSNLINLLTLRLNSNLLEGNIPPQLGNLSNLAGLSLTSNQLSGNIPPELGNLTNLDWMLLDFNQLNGNLPSDFGNLVNLSTLRISNNNLSGCYPNSLNSLCFNNNSDISYGNNFDATWEDFCATGAGACDNDSMCGCTDPTACNYNPNATCDDGSCQQDCETFVYPGDLNHDGIVNNQDVSLSGLFQYQTGIARAQEHQNIEWNLYPSQNWGILNNQNKDIKHHDCDGNGYIDESDTLAVVNNMGKTWKTPDPPPPSPSVSDYRVILQPTDQVYDGNLVMNVSLERRAGGDLTMQGGHFTVDYSDIEGSFSYVDLAFLPISWLGTPNNNLWYESTHFPDEKKIEVGFTKTNNTDSEGNGAIGQLILEYDIGSAKRANTSYNFEVNTIGVHQNNGNFIPIEDQQLEIIINSNICHSNLIIDEDAPFKNLYQSSNNITTNGLVLIGTDQEVEYNANRVRINSGFSVKSGAEFKVRSSGCN